ncbi:MAG: putative IMPACT (imprinted ancient) family translation regulator [Bacteroidia bacterium]
MEIFLEAEHNSYQFTSIASNSEALYKQQNSKFFGFAYPVSSEDDVKTELNGLREIYPDASHHCFAYQLGKDGGNFRINDDGEPGNSAGAPIYRAIQAANITNVLVVVVRYFGGKKLGVPGLIEAYGEAARLCLDAATRVVKEPMIRFRLKSTEKLDYKVYEFASRYGVNVLLAPVVVGSDFTMEVKISEWENIKKMLEDLPNIFSFETNLV